MNPPNAENLKAGLEELAPKVIALAEKFDEYAATHRLFEYKLNSVVKEMHPFPTGVVLEADKSWESLVEDFCRYKKKHQQFILGTGCVSAEFLKESGRFQTVQTFNSTELEIFAEGERFLVGFRRAVFCTT